MPAHHIGSYVQVNPEATAAGLTRTRSLTWRSHPPHSPEAPRLPLSSPGCSSSASRSATRTWTPPPSPHTELLVRGSLKFLMAILSLVGITGMYLSQVRRNGVLGLIGYLVLATGYLLITCVTYLAAFVVPHLATINPAYVDDLIDEIAGRASTADVGLFAAAIQVQNYTFLAGGLIFGIALYRAGVLARWATALLAVGGVVTILLSVLPDAFYRLLAFPNGIAMVGLGVSLWLTSRSTRRARLRDGRCRVRRPTRLGSGPAPWLPAALVALSLVPVLSGSARLVELAGGPAAVAGPAPTRRPCRWCCTSSAAACSPSWARSSSRAGSGGATPGLAPPAGRGLVVVGALLAGLSGLVDDAVLRPAAPAPARCSTRSGSCFGDLGDGWSPSSWGSPRSGGATSAGTARGSRAGTRRAGARARRCCS